MEEKQKFRKRKISILGRQIPVWVLVLTLIGGLGSATLLTYFGTITTTVDVTQAVTLNGNEWDTPTIDAYSIYNGWEQKKTSSVNLLSNTANRNIRMDITSTTENGITTSRDSVGMSTTWSSNELASADASLSGNTVTLEANEHAVDWSDASESRIVIEANDIENLLGLTADLTLNDLETISWNANVINGYVPHVDVFLDNGKTLVFEFAKTNPASCDVTPYPLGVMNTFGVNGIVDTNAYGWLSSGPAGPCGDPIFEANHKSLADWKVSDGNVKVLRLELEVDAWISNTKSEISNIAINGATKTIETISNPITVNKESAEVFYTNSIFADNLDAGSYVITTTVDLYEE